ncbi:MAG: TIGR04255 family protein [Actinobacteria bacterium]|nr:TIGR04255 family protein [Actinomycetota bacterium]
MADTHEVYPSAPLALVAVEVRFPEAAAERPLPMPLQRSFRDLLGKDWVIESQRMPHLDVAFGLGGAGSQSVQQVVVPRFTLRDRTLAVAVTDASLTVETTNYCHYGEFRGVLRRVFDAAEQLLAPDGIARVGMRYIDEIRVPDVSEEHPETWRYWLDATLLPPRLDAMVADQYLPAAWDGAVRYATGPQRSLVLRYGARQGYAVQPRGNLSRPSPPAPGPFFVLDFDSFWEPLDIPAFESQELTRTCDELRTPVRTLFDLLITDKLCTEVFMKGRDDG